MKLRLPVISRNPGVSADPSHRPQLQEAIRKYQDPANADQLTKIQRDLDDTKVGGAQREGIVPAQKT